jgi:hypothetical protein
MKRLFQAAALALLILGAASPLTAQAPLLDLYPAFSITGSAYARPWADEPLAGVGVRGDLILDGYAFDYLWVYLSLQGYTNLAGLGDDSAWVLDADLRHLTLSAEGNGRLQFLGEIKEAWFDFPAGDFDVRIGKQIFAWGLADGNNPTDILNARHVGTRLVSTLDEQKIGSPAVNLVYNLPGNLGKVQGVFLPMSVPADLPSLAREITVPGPTTMAITINDDQAADISLENVEGGLRSLLYLGPLTFSASYFTGLDRYADFNVVDGFTPPSTVTITLNPVHNRIHQVGLDAALVTGGWDLRTEWALTLTEDRGGEDPAVKNPGLNGVIQASRSFRDGTITASAAWSPRFVFNHRNPEDYADPSDGYLAEEIRKYDGQAYAWENVLTARLAGKFLMETVQPELMFLAETAARDWLGTASVSWNVADGWTLKGGAGFYGSFLAEDDSDRELGTFSKSSVIDNDYFFIEMKYSY